MADGLVACQCRACRPDARSGAVQKNVSCSEFEEHAGSRERRPAESIYLAALGLSLRVSLHCSLGRVCSKGFAVCM